MGAMRGAHLRKQVQGSDAHGTGGGGRFSIMIEPRFAVRRTYHA